MLNNTLTVAADRHILESRDTWLAVIAPFYRDRAMRFARDDAGDEVLMSVLSAADQTLVLGAMGCVLMACGGEFSTPAA